MTCGCRGTAWHDVHESMMELLECYEKLNERKSGALENEIVRSRV